MVASKSYIFEHVVLDLVGKLEGISTGNGKTLLDRAMVVWASEHGNLTHQTTSVPIVTFGGANGALRTGNLCDYRNTALKLRNSNSPGEIANEYLGLTLNQFFGSTLQVMGVPRSQYQESDHNGYGCRPRAGIGLGDTINNLRVSDAYPEPVWAVAGEMLPWL
jgi:hypothetical protein